MNKLNGTTGQLFSAIAETINARGAARSGKGAGAPAKADSSFHDLMHTVSNMAKQALSDQDHPGPAKPAALRARVAPLAERDQPGDEPVRERGKTDAEADSSNKSAPPDHSAKVEVPSLLPVASIVGQELAAVAALKPQAQPPNGDRDAAPRRTEPSSTAGQVPVASAATTKMPDVAEAGPRPSAAAPQGATAQPGVASAPKSMAAVAGFEAVAADIAYAAKASGREALPEATKVTVVQQETHFPPVAQFTATQQVADAVVAELKGSSAPASSAAPDLASPQNGAPAQPLRILTISLQPPALGNVTVRLRLVGTDVSVHLAAERRDTSQMLDQQRDSIRELMQSAGYVADVAPVQHGALDRFQAGSGQSQASFSGQQQSPQAQVAPDGSSASSGQSQGEARQARQERQPNQETRHDQDLAPHNRRGAVYL